MHYLKRYNHHIYFGWKNNFYFAKMNLIFLWLRHKHVNLIQLLLLLCSDILLLEAMINVNFSSVVLCHSSLES